MDFMGILGVAIGLITVYLVMALSVSAANEGIAALLSSRGRWLKKGVLSLLSPAGQPGGVLEWMNSMRSTTPSEAETLVDGVYHSPFISHLAQGPLGHGYSPSYVPAWALLQGMLFAATKKAQTAFNTLDQIRKAVEGLPATSPLRVAVLNLSDGCNGSMDEFRKRFEAWFAEFENQVIAWYRQKTHAVLIVLSLALAVAGNVDTIALTRQLSNDPKVREAVVKQGLEMANANQVTALLDSEARDKALKAYQDKQTAEKAARTAISAAAKEPTVAETVKKALSDAEAATQAALTNYLSEQQKLEQRAVDKLKALDSSGLKLGWAPGEWDHLAGPALWLKLLGLLLSGLAISLGAPFWFEVLKSLAAIRSVGQNPTEKAAKKVS